MKFTSRHLILSYLMWFNMNTLKGQSSYEIEGGLNISAIEPAIATSNYQADATFFGYSKPLIGYSFGLSGNFKLTKDIELSAGIDYDQNGYEVFREIHHAPGGGNTADFTRLNLIGVRLIFMYGLPLGSGKISIGAGTKISYPISGNTMSKDSSFFLHSLTITNTAISSKKIVPGISSILKYQFNSGIFFKIDFDYLFQVQPELMNVFGNPPPVNLSVFGFSAGYSFSIKK